MNNIDEDIKGKEILIMPYCHSDFAWTNTRDWHICRYIKGIEDILDLMRVNSEITWIIDNVIHSLLPFMENCPERVPELKQRVKEGRIYIANGGYSLARPTYVGEETYIRNLVEGKKLLKELLEVPYELDFLFNADTCCGHSQLPQIMKLTGHKYYRFYRPEVILNYKKIPKQFVWSGLDGSAVVVSRGNYGGFMNADYMDMNFDTQWDEIKKQFYQQELKERLDLLPTSVVMLNHGCDDSFPLHNVFDKPINLLNFINEWNMKEDSIMKFSTPIEYFKKLENVNLPLVEGVLEQCELSFNMPIKNEKSMWRKRLELELIIIKLEKLCSISSAYGIEYPSDEIKQLWRDTFEITGHAIECVLKNDYDYLYNIAITTLCSAKLLTDTILKKLSMTVGTGSNFEYLVVNTLSYDTEQTVKLHITSAYGVKNFELCDIDGQILEYQIIESYTGDKNYLSCNYNAIDVYVKVKVKATSLTLIIVKEKDSVFDNVSDKKYLITAPEELRDIRKNIMINNGIISTEFMDGKLIKAYNTVNNVQYTSNSLTALYDLRFVETNPTNDWTSDRKIVKEYKFIPEKTVLIHNGSILWKYEVIGRVAGHFVNQVYIINKLENTVNMEVKIDSTGLEGYFAADFACDVDTKINVDIPYGVEERELSKEISWKEGEAKDPWGILEQSYRGQFYGTSWSSFTNCGQPVAVLSKNCSIYYNYNDQGRISIILNRNLDINKRSNQRECVWLKQTPDEMNSKGIQRYSFSLMFRDNNSNFVDIIRKCRELRYPNEVLRKFSKGLSMKPDRNLISIDKENVIVTALYKEDDSYIVRMYEALGKESVASVSTLSSVKSVYKTNMLGETIQKLDITSDDLCTILSLPLKQWEIVTLRLEI